MKQRKETYSQIEPPAELIRVKVEKNWRYGKHAMFWEVQQFNQELSNRYNEVYYSRMGRGGLAYTKLGLKFAVWKKLRKMKHGSSTNYYNTKLNHLEGQNDS